MKLIARSRGAGMLAALLAAAVLCASALVGLRLLAAEPALAEPAVPIVGTPTVPLSVTTSRSFTVTGSLDAAPADPLVVSCYLRNAEGAFALERSFPATVAPAASGAVYSASVSLDAPGIWVLRAETTGTPSPSVSATSSDIRVSNRSDAIVWNRDGVLTAPERMRFRSDARQLIIATADTLASHAGTLTVYEYRSGDWIELFSSPCRFGRNGLCEGAARRRGNGTTPTGIWRMPGFVFGQHALKPAGTRLEYRHITRYNWWSAEKGSHYNTWLWSRGWVDGEHLINYQTAYEYALSTGYNARPNESVYGRGSGIFLHVWQGATTSGCVSVPRATMQRVFRTMDPTKRRVFVVGTAGPTGRTRVELY